MNELRLRFTCRELLGNLAVTLEIAYLILVSLDNGAKMSPKRRTLLSLIFACLYVFNYSQIA